MRVPSFETTEDLGSQGSVLPRLGVTHILGYTEPRVTRFRIAKGLDFQDSRLDRVEVTQIPRYHILDYLDPT